MLQVTRERQRAGIERAKAAGIYTGDERRLDRERIKAMRDDGIGPAAVVSALNCSRMHVYRVIANQ